MPEVNQVLFFNFFFFFPLLFDLLEIELFVHSQNSSLLGSGNIAIII